MKKLMIALVLFSLSAPVFSMTVGKVNIQEILLTVKEGKKINGELKAEFDKKTKEIKAEEAKIKKAQEAYEKQSLVMNDKAKAKKEAEIQKMIMGIQQKTMGYQREIQAKEQKLMKPVLEKIKSVIEEVSKDAKVDITYEVSASGVVFAANEKDLTKDVIKAYDKKHPVK